MEDTKKFFISVAAIVIFVINILAYSNYLFGLRHAEFKEEIGSMGISIQEGSVKSPAVIITLENKTSFLAKIIELEATTIYYSGSGSMEPSARYYVFTEDYNIAYRFDFIK